MGLERLFFQRGWQAIAGAIDGKLPASKSKPRARRVSLETDGSLSWVHSWFFHESFKVISFRSDGLARYIGLVERLDISKRHSLELMSLGGYCGCAERAADGLTSGGLCYCVNLGSLIF